VSGKPTRRPSKQDPPSRGRADLRHLRRITEAEIADTSPPDLADLPDDFWDDAEMVVPPPARARNPRVAQTHKGHR
jgi:hypothetical protein